MSTKNRKGVIKNLFALLACIICFYGGYWMAMQKAHAIVEQTRINVERVLKEAAKEFDRKERAYIETENIEFSRCSCDDAMYCLSDEQYSIIISQLSARENKCEPN